MCVLWRIPCAHLIRSCWRFPGVFCLFVCFVLPQAQHRALPFSVNIFIVLHCTVLLILLLHLPTPFQESLLFCYTTQSICCHSGPLGSPTSTWWRPWLPCLCTGRNRKDTLQNLRHNRNWDWGAWLQLQQTKWTLVPSFPFKNRWPALTFTLENLFGREEIRVSAHCKEADAHFHNAVFSWRSRRSPIKNHLGNKENTSSPCATVLSHLRFIYQIQKQNYTSIIARGRKEWYTEPYKVNIMAWCI